jgi:hypothetical protein
MQKTSSVEAERCLGGKEHKPREIITFLLMLWFWVIGLAGLAYLNLALWDAA